MNEYNKQAEEWLEKTKTKIDIKRVPEWLQKEPNWQPHGHQYKVTLEKGGSKFSFDFWDSIYSKENRKRPTSYDVLTCLAVDTYTDETMSLGEFMSEYGYEVKDVDKCADILNQLQKQNRTLKAMYSETELQDLQLIN